jgi:hypothetical protein
VVAVPRPLLDLRNDAWFTGLVVAVGVFAGIALWGVTAGLSRSHIAGSISGNSFLVIPFGFGPTVIAGGWAAIILRMRGHPRWLQLGFVSGLVGVGLVGASLLSLIVFGPAHREVGSTFALLFGFLLYGWLLASPIIAALVPAPDPHRQGLPLWSVAAIALLPVTLIAGCEAGVGVLPT